jgi:hypothetical protein
MAASTAPVLLTGGATMLADYLNGKGVEFRVALATGIAAGLLALMEEADAPAAVGIAWLAFAASMITPRSNGTPSPAQTFLTAWQHPKRT